MVVGEDPFSEIETPGINKTLKNKEAMVWPFVVFKFGS